MIVVNTINSQRFSLNGIEYYKNFTPVVAGDSIRIINVYGSCLDLLPSTNYSQFNVNGNTYANVADLQSALLPVLFTRDSLGSEFNFRVSIENTNVSGVYNIDWSESSNWELTLTGNTTITESNLPPSGTEKTITIYLSGDFALTLPLEWVISDGVYNGVSGSQLVIQARSNTSTKYYAVFNSI